MAPRRRGGRSPGRAARRQLAVGLRSRTAERVSGIQDHVARSARTRRGRDRLPAAAGRVARRRRRQRRIPARLSRRYPAREARERGDPGPEPGRELRARDHGVRTIRQHQAGAGRGRRAGRRRDHRARPRRWFELQGRVERARHVAAIRARQRHRVQAVAPRLRSGGHRARRRPRRRVPSGRRGGAEPARLHEEARHGAVNGGGAKARGHHVRGGRRAAGRIRHRALRAAPARQDSPRRSRVDPCRGRRRRPGRGAAGEARGRRGVRDRESAQVAAAPRAGRAPRHELAHARVQRRDPARHGWPRRGHRPQQPEQGVCAGRAALPRQGRTLRRARQDRHLVEGTDAERAPRRRLSQLRSRASSRRRSSIV